MKFASCPNGHRWSLTASPPAPIASPPPGDARGMVCPQCGMPGSLNSTDGTQSSLTLPGSPDSQSAVSGQLLTPIVPEPSPTSFGRYVVIGELGRGGMGIVYRVFDPKHQRYVALKTLYQASPVALQRFKDEFRQVLDARHENLAEQFELYNDDGRWYFTMELLEGVDILTYLKLPPSDAPSTNISDAAPAGGANEPPTSDGVTSYMSSGAVADPNAVAPLAGRWAGASSTVDFRVANSHLDDADEAARDRKLRSVFAQLLRGLAHLHQCNVLHRDLKPSNIWVTTEGRVVILDYGLALEIPRDGQMATSSKSILGTVTHMSPEQAACRTINEASDWYSFGALLYEALTGELPFSGPVVQVLIDKQFKNPKPPRDLNPRTPADLNELCVALLSREPEKRPDPDRILAVLDGSSPPQLTAPRDTSALKLVGRDPELSELREAYRALENGQGMNLFVSGRSGMGKSTLVEAFLGELRHTNAAIILGRCYEQESVPFKALDSLIDSLTTFLLVAQETAGQVELYMPRDAALLVRLFPVLGQVEVFSSAPQRAADVVDQKELKRRGIAALRELLCRIGDQRPLVLYIDDLQWGDEDSAAMLADLLEPPDAPVMLLIGTFRSEDKTESPFLRSLDEIRRLRRTAFEARELEIEPLTAEQAETLALQLLADAPAETREQTLAAVRDSGGNPMFVAELARFAELNASPTWDSASSLSNNKWDSASSLSDNKWDSASSLSANKWDSASSLSGSDPAAASAHQPATAPVPAPPSQSPSPPSATSRPDSPSASTEHRLILDDMLWSRVRRLTDEAQLLLGLVATAGQPIPLAVAAEAAGVPPPPPGLLNKLRSEHLVRTVGVDDHVTIGTYHDRVRESIARKLEPERRRTHHLHLAQVLESRASLSVEVVQRLAADGALDSTSNLTGATAARQLQLAYDLAVHYDAGGDMAKALAYAGITARHAQQKYALDIAERQYRIAERNAVGASDAVRFDIWVGLGDVLLLRGRYPEAHERFRQARAIAADDRARAHIEGKLGEVAFKRGDIREALVATETALRLLKQRIRRHTAAFLLPLCREVIVHLLHAWMPNRFINRLGVAPNDEQREVMRLLGRLSYAYWFTHSKFHVFWAHLRHMNLAECYAPSRELAQAYSNHAPAMSLVGRFERGLRYSQRAIDIHKHLGDRQGEGQALHFRGVTRYAASQFEEAIEMCREAIGLLEQLGDYWEMNMARYQLAAALFRLGRLDEAAAEAQRMHRSGRELGDSQAAGLSLDLWAFASGGKIPADTAEAERRRVTAIASDPQQVLDAQATTQVLQADGVRLVSDGRLADAIEVLTEAHGIAARAGIKNTYVLPSLAWLATANRLAAQRVGASASNANEPHRRDLLPKDVDRATLLARAARAAAQATRIARTFQNDLPHALREQGLVAGLQGRDAAARAALNESLAVAERQHARYEQALTLLARGRLGRKLGWAEAASDLQSGDELLRSLTGSPDVVSFAETLSDCS